MCRVLTLCVGLLAFGSFWHTSTAAAEPILITSGTIAVDDGLGKPATASYDSKLFSTRSGGLPVRLVNAHATCAIAS